MLYKVFLYRSSKTDSNITSHKIEMAEKDQTIMETHETIQVTNCITLVDNFIGILFTCVQYSYCR